MKTSGAALRDAEKALHNLHVSVEIERFLSGKSDGGALFRALYGDIGAEPVPDRLLAVVRSARSGGGAEVVPIDPALRRRKS